MSPNHLRCSMSGGYLVRFNERRPNGRTRAMKVQRIGPAPIAEVWRWVADMLKGSTPEVLGRLVEVKVVSESIGETTTAGAPNE